MVHMAPQGSLDCLATPIGSLRTAFAAGLLLLLAIVGCGGPVPSDLVVYSALDGDFSEPVLEDFGKEQGLKVAPKFDTEAAKTIGLYQAIVAEKDRPRCDVFWNNEILSTL